MLSKYASPLESQEFVRPLLDALAGAATGWVGTGNRSEKSEQLSADVWNRQQE